MLNEYAVRLRRAFHRHPEIGFDLPCTLATVRQELKSMGVPFTEQYGRSAIVATIAPDHPTDFTIGIRADMDALPIDEVNEVPYRSEVPGVMHACGHDAHTAILLATAKELAAIRPELRCTVKCIFQPAEEYPPSGAKLMVESGVMQDIDCIVALHCDTKIPVGSVGLSAGAQGAISDGFYLDFYGKSSHVANQHKGIDAIAMAVRAYTALEMLIAKEVDAKDPVIFNVGAIEGGITNNIIADHCRMFCTLRTHREETEELLLNRMKEICEGTARTSGGQFTFTVSKHYPIVYNNAVLVEKMRQTAEKTIGKEQITGHPRSLGGEDFSYFSAQKPGMMFRLGVRNEEKGITAGAHHNNFDIDENALDVGVRMFVRFVLDNQDGISF